MSDAGAIAVVGNAVAALAAAERLADAGQEVNLFCTGTPGSSFAGLELDGHRVRFGLRLIEREYVAGENIVPSPPLNTHIPGHGGHRPWMGMIESYLCDLVPDLEPVPVPRLVVGGRSVEDFTLTGQLGAMRAMFSKDELGEIGRQASEILDRFGNEAGILALPHQYAEASLAEASLANHGELFHRRIVQPIARALIPDGDVVVAADQRHKIWAPLYWPSTLHEAATGRDVRFDPQRQFWTDREGGMRSVVDNLVARLRDAHNVNVRTPGNLTAISAGDDGTNLRFADGLELTVRDPIIGVSPGELFAAAGIHYRPERVRMNLAWALVAEDRVSGVAPTTLLQPGFDVFRVSASGARRAASGLMCRTFCVELRHDALAGPDITGEALFVAGLVDRIDDVTYLGSRDFDAFVLPSHQSRAHYEHAHRDLREKIPGMTLVGGAAGYGADPLNEQLLGGIRAALEVSGAHV